MGKQLENSFLAGNELVPSMTKNTDAGHIKAFRKIFLKLIPDPDTAAFNSASELVLIQPGFYFSNKSYL